MQEDWTTKQIDKYLLVNKKLGSGAFGTVYRGFKIDDESFQVAVKTIPIKQLKDSAKMIELIKREIQILQNSIHPHIVKLYDVARTPHFLYLFLEYCNDGDLKKYLQSKAQKRLSEMEAVIFLKHIVAGFKQLYNLKIIHRDIKPANILLKNGVAKITDFGFARYIDVAMDEPSHFSRVGSPLYMAPQILEGSPFSSKCDVWSMGIMMYELLYGSTPWDGDSQYNLLQSIKKQPLKFPNTPARSDKIKKLVTNMLQVNEKDRIGWEQIFKCDVILIDENKIKENFNVIMMEDEKQNSSQLNKIYDPALVIGYLENVEVIEQQLQTEMKASLKEQDDYGGINQNTLNSDFNQEKGQEVINQMDVETKRRKSMLKYNSYFLFERNVAFFFNFIMQKIIQVTQSQAAILHFKKNDYYYLIFCISKNQNVHMIRLFKQLQELSPTKFDKETWGRYLASKEYQKILQLVKNDTKSTKDFFEEIFKRCFNITEKEIEAKNPVATQFKSILDNNFEYNEDFQVLYKRTISESIGTVKNAMSKAKTKFNHSLLFVLAQNSVNCSCSIGCS